MKTTAIALAALAAFLLTGSSLLANGYGCPRQEPSVLGAIKHAVVSVVRELSDGGRQHELAVRREMEQRREMAFRREALERRQAESFRANQAARELVALRAREAQLQAQFSRPGARHDAFRNDGCYTGRPITSRAAFLDR